MRIKLAEFKGQKKEELRKAEEFKFKQQINEFELHERVSTLEQAYRRQESEINKQANANEILKFEKMKLMAYHSKRLVQIENAIGKIQISKKRNNPAEVKRHTRGHSTVLTQPTKQILDKNQRDA